MAKSLAMKEIRTKGPGEAHKLLVDLSRELQGLRFKVVAADLKNVRSIRELRQTIARLKTYLASQSR